MATSSYNPEARRLYKTLQDVHFLHRLKMEELEHLLGAMKKRRVKAGTVVFSQGDAGDAFFLVSEGRFVMTARKGLFGKEEVLTDLIEGEYFGENSLIQNDKRQATVTAQTDGMLFVLYKKDFEQILMHNPQVAQAIKAHGSTVRSRRVRKQA